MCKLDIITICKINVPVYKSGAGLDPGGLYCQILQQELEENLIQCFILISLLTSFLDIQLDRKFN